MSHRCPNPECGTSILENRWCCYRCYLKLSPATRDKLRRRFQGTAEDHLTAVTEGMAELAQPVRRTG